MIANENSMSGDRTLQDEPDGAVLARIDQYELVRELGGGGFGTVYLAKDTVSGVEYAVKGLPPLVKNCREELENIRANFALVSRLSHTNIARAHVLHPAKEVSYASEDVRQKLRVLSGDFLMVMEYAPGVTLSQWRRQFPERKVPMAQALEITRQIASALDYAHEQKILHRDVKPANVMVETKQDGRLVARVLDFGLAAEIRSSMGRVSREIQDTSGTRQYMAPEQWLGQRQGPATDQYALAVLFYELTTGDVPFASVFDTGDPVVMMNVVGRELFTPAADLPKAVRRAIEKALVKKPEGRFASCTEFVAALQVRDVFNSRYGKMGLIALVLTLLGVGGACWWMRNLDDPAPTMISDSPCSSVRPSVPLAEKKERKTLEGAERKAKSVDERKRQQEEAEAEIDDVLVWNRGKVDGREVAGELRKVWRKQVKSIYGFALPSFVFTGYKKISSIRRAHHEEAVLASEKRLEVPTYPVERIEEIVKKMEEEGKESGVNADECRNALKHIQTSFLLAALGCKKALAFMFENQISEPNFVSDGGYLHLAAAIGRTDMIDFLLERGAYIDMPDKDRQTPVSWALAGENRLATIKHMVARGASIYNVRRDKSLLKDAVSDGALDVVEYIIEELGYEPDDVEYAELMKDERIPSGIKKHLQGLARRGHAARR